MSLLKAVIAAAVAVGFGSAASAGNSTYAGGPKGSSAISASRTAPTAAENYASMSYRITLPVTRSPQKGSIAGRKI